MAKQEESRDFGELDAKMTSWLRRSDARYRVASRQPVAAPRASGFQIVEGEGGAPDALLVFGENMSPATSVTVNGSALPTTFVDATTVRASLEGDEKRATNGSVINVTDDASAMLLGYPHISRSSIAISNVMAEPPVPRAGERFDLVVSFAPSDARPSFLKVVARYPDGERCEGVFRLSKKEAAAGVKRLRGFASGWGLVRFDVTAYGTGEAAASYRAGVEVVPTNPLQLSVFPLSSSTSGAGAAQYDATTGIYSCRARCVFANGYDFDVQVFPDVIVLVKNRGALLTSFWFSMGRSYTVAANSTREIRVRTYYGNSATSAVFDSHGEVEIELLFVTSAGALIDSAIWVMMAQVQVACMFVGNFSNAQKDALQNLLSTDSSAIYESEDITLTTSPHQSLPASSPDWERFRVIDITCKDGPTSSEANDLRSNWSTSYPEHIDVFFVESFATEACATGALGLAEVPGPASKDGPGSGVVIALGDRSVFDGDDAFVLGIGIAHEIGHYLGLNHWSGSSQNFMHASAAGTTMTSDQADVVTAHPWVRRLNP